MGTDLRGKTLSVLGLGRIGSQIARIASAFGMNLIAWSQNLTPEAAKAAGAILVTKDQLFELLIIGELGATARTHDHHEDF